MTEYLFRLEVRADKRSFTVAEALEAVVEAIHPDCAADQPVMIQSINKVLMRGRGDRPTALDESDWELLRVIWSRLDEPQFPMSLRQWEAYFDAFNSSPNKPGEWGLSTLQRDPELQTELKRAFASHDHREVLKRAVNAGEIKLRNPQSGIASELGWIGDADSWLLSREQFKKLCDLLAIEIVSVPHFVTSACPESVAPELLELPRDALITYEENIGGSRGDGICSAGDYRDAIQETIARQAEGYFTLSEAAQVLADSRPGLDSGATVKRFRVAHAKGELPIHQGVSRFSLEVGETIRDFHDLLEATELDAWLRASAGYGFPKAEGVAEPSPSDWPGARAVAMHEQAPDRGRHVKRAALIADNVRSWPTIERDLKDAAANGLSEAARDAAVGWWWEGSALAWARARAKVCDAAGSGLAGMAGTIHRMKG